MYIEFGFTILIIISIALVYLINYSSEFRIKNHHIIIGGILIINVLIMTFIIGFFYYKKDYQGISGVKGEKGDIGPDGNNNIKCLS